MEKLVFHSCLGTSAPDLVFIQRTVISSCGRLFFYNGGIWLLGRLPRLAHIELPLGLSHSKATDGWFVLLGHHLENNDLGEFLFCYLVFKKIFSSFLK